MLDPQKPNANTYWILPGKFLAGDYPGDADTIVAQYRINRYPDCGMSF